MAFNSTRHDYKTADRSARARLFVHDQLMEKYMASGLTKDAASQKAYNEIIAGEHKKEIKAKIQDLKDRQNRTGAYAVKNRRPRVEVAPIKKFNTLPVAKDQAEEPPKGLVVVVQATWEFSADGIDLEDALITIDPNLINPLLGVGNKEQVQARIVVIDQKTGKRDHVYPVGTVSITREVR